MHGNYTFNFHLHTFTKRHKYNFSSCVNSSQPMAATLALRIEMDVPKLSVLKGLNVLMYLHLVLGLCVDPVLQDTLVMV